MFYFWNKAGQTLIQPCYFRRGSGTEPFLIPLMLAVGFLLWSLPGPSALCAQCTWFCFSFVRCLTASSLGRLVPPVNLVHKARLHLLLTSAIGLLLPCFTLQPLTKLVNFLCPTPNVHSSFLLRESISSWEPLSVCTAVLAILPSLSCQQIHKHLLKLFLFHSLLSLLPVSPLATKLHCTLRIGIAGESVSRNQTPSSFNKQNCS